MFQKLPKSLHLLLLLFFLVTALSGRAQDHTWNRSYYEKYTEKNFREFAGFQEKLNLDQLDYARLNACVFYLTNELRAKRGIKTLGYVPGLEIAAWQHARLMAEKDFFSHRNKKDKSRKEPSDRARLAGIENPSIAENIAKRWNYGNDLTYLETADAFIQQWLNSDGHRENIYSSKALQLGCGIFIQGNDYLAVQCFQWFNETKSTGKGKDALP